MACVFPAIKLSSVFRRANLAEYPEKPSTQPIQEHGYANLADLPVELLLEIISYFPHQTACKEEILRTMIGPEGCYIPWKVLEYDYFARPETLRALSQTNRKLRSVFLGVLWEDLDACAIRYRPTTNKSWETSWKEIARVMEGSFQGVLDNRELLGYVRQDYILRSRAGDIY
jgi:hypothetical protein